jgi:GT2 family glycosyltransferase
MTPGADPQYSKSLPLPSSIDPRPVLADLSVVIPTLGRPILETCLSHLVDGSRWPAAVIVVDQGRVAAVAEMVAGLEQIGLGAEYVPSMQRGRSAGLNRGLERVRTRFVAITDDDCFVAADWLERMAGCLRSEPDAIVTGRVELAGNEEAPFSVVSSLDAKRYTRPGLKVHPFIGGNAGMAMATVGKIGAFDEDPCLASAEDSDYGHRALRLGVPIVYRPEVLLHHYHWRDQGERATRYAEYARSQGGFYGTHLRHGDPLVALQAARALVRSPLRWLRGILKRDPELIENGRASTANLLPGILAGLRRRTSPGALASRGTSEEGPPPGGASERSPD